jgi:ubiquinone/menaquinone biosynthesis C-methylase UbiE
VRNHHCVTQGTQASFKPALNFSALTRWFDPAVALGTRERAFKRRVVERAQLTAGEAALDLGCGTGTLALMLHAEQPGAEIVGLDADPEILSAARRKAATAIDFDQGMSNDLPYAEAQFDLVVSTLFFHHLSDTDKATTASEVLRVLKPGGRLVVADAGRAQDPLMRVASFGTLQLLDGFATTSLNIAGGLPRLLADAGFADVEVTDRFRTPIGTIEVITAQSPRTGGK